MPSRRSFQMLNKGISAFSSCKKEIKTEIPKSRRHFIRMRQPFLPNVVTFAFETKDFFFRKYILLDPKVYTFALKSTHKRFRKYRTLPEAPTPPTDVSANSINKVHYDKQTNITYYILTNKKQANIWT